MPVVPVRPGAPGVIIESESVASLVGEEGQKFSQQSRQEAGGAVRGPRCRSFLRGAKPHAAIRPQPTGLKHFLGSPRGEPCR
jgi:hypothetical protein